MPTQHFDVAIAGAGPAGAAAARRLRRSGCRVVLLERSGFNAPRVGESLAPATQPLLRELGVWSEFESLSPLPSYGTRSAWGSSDVTDHSHVMSPYGCGWHVDRLAFDRMLVAAAAAAGVDVRTDTSLLHCEAARDGRWMLHVATRDARSPDLLRARVLIDATGRSAHVGRRLGAERHLFDRLVGVATLFADVDTSRQGYVLVETARDGWWYSAPLPGGRMIAMLMTDGDLCGRGRVCTPAAWHERLADAPATTARVAGTARWGPHVFSALSQRLQRRDRDAPWIAIGDAALAVDPITGSGVVRALRSARAGSEAALALLGGAVRHIVDAYEAERDQECASYLRERALYYGAEQRWQESPFWRQRSEYPQMLDYAT
jgi:flavin-dependent dehydrogenase